MHSQILFALIPLISFAGLSLILRNRLPELDNRELWIKTSLLFGAYLVGILELLSLVKGVTRLGLIIAWTIPIVFVAAWAARKWKDGQPVHLPVFRWPSGFEQWLLMFLTIAVLAITFLVAWKTPPQTWDALTYHMSRIAHWAQNRSVWHYSSGIRPQISMGPGAEYITLNSYVLAGSDRLATFTQWFSMLGSLVGVSLITRRLGAKPLGQWLAACFAATIPIGIVESSSTINDYVAAFWLVGAVVESLAYYQSGKARSLVFFSLAAGLAVLTKPVTVPYLIPFGLWLTWLIFKRQHFMHGLKWAVIALLIMGAINAGYLSRNLITFGSISNPADFALHANQLRDLRGLASILIKNAGMHAGLPYLPKVNARLNLLILNIHIRLGLDIQDPRTTSIGVFKVRPPSTQEDLTTNPYHAYLILGAFLLMLFLWKRIGKLAVFYGLMVASAFILFSFLFKWQVFGARFHLLFFILFMPVLGVILASFEPFKLGTLAAILLFIGSIPWLISINSRPLVPKPGRSSVGSILSEPREKLYFANASSTTYEVYKAMTDEIKGRDCKSVGIMLGGNDPEYLIWHMLGAPRPDLKLDWIVNGPTSRYELPGFQPCAVICNGCSEDLRTIRGLEPAMQIGEMQLFLEPESKP